MSLPGNTFSQPFKSLALLLSLVGRKLDPILQIHTYIHTSMCMRAYLIHACLHVYTLYLMYVYIVHGKGGGRPNLVMPSGNVSSAIGFGSVLDVYQLFHFEIILRNSKYHVDTAFSPTKRLLSTEYIIDLMFYIEVKPSWTVQFIHLYRAFSDVKRNGERKKKEEERWGIIKRKLSLICSFCVIGG
jgi:hypothetical protein